MNKMKYITVLLAGLLCTLCAGAQEYNVTGIPDSLKKGANAVKRFEELRVVIKGVDRAVLYHKYAITVLNEQGDAHAGYTNSYDKLHALSDISGRLYDASGKVLQSVKRKDITDAIADNEISIVTDDRIKRHQFYYRQYPYTVEYEDEEDYKGVFFLPRWQPVEDEDFAVQHSRLVVETATDYQLRYKQFSYAGAPQLTENGKSKVYTWEIKNQVPIQHEYLQPNWSEVTTSVVLAPVDFAIGGYAGNMSTWQNLGKFISQLNSGRDLLPEPVKKEVHTLTDGVSDKKEKIRLLYEYLQKNTRYISVSIGIGGWQPFDANYVATKKYGDCKALSNYMTTLLKEAGITAYYTLINSGEGRRGVWEDFPAPYFNHAIVCVPDGKDSVWLECTSQTVSAGFMGSSTGDRQALLMTEEGGKIAWTPRYRVSDNEQLRRINAEIDAEGNLVADVYTVFTGIQQELQHDIIHHTNKEQREKYLNNALNLPTYKVDKIDYSEQKKAIPVVNEYLHVLSAAYATTSGKRLFVTPNLFNRSTHKLSTDKPRKFDIVYTYAYRDIDSIFIKIPEGYTPEALPKNVALSNQFGKYEISYELVGNMIKVLRINEKIAGRYPPADYEELSKFYADIYKADRNRMVFVKQ
jgi:transglutaminase-like putative cysteine protease